MERFFVKKTVAHTNSHINTIKDGIKKSKIVAAQTME
jgi:hypothetical protein